MVAQKELSSALMKLEPADGASIANQLLVALILCGVDGARAKDHWKVTARAALSDVILGELSVSKSDIKILTENRIKAARAAIRNEKSPFHTSDTREPGVCSDLSPAAAEMFPDTFSKADKKALEKTQSGSMDTLKVPMDPLSEWQRIAAGPHPLSIFETAWILVHFRLRNVHSGGF